MCVRSCFTRRDGGWTSGLPGKVSAACGTCPKSHGVVPRVRFSSRFRHPVRFPIPNVIKDSSTPLPMHHETQAADRITISCSTKVPGLGHLGQPCGTRLDHVAFPVITTDRGISSASFLAAGPGHVVSLEPSQIESRGRDTVRPEAVRLPSGKSRYWPSRAT